MRNFLPKMMIVAGMQKGDEGKGKVIDALTEFFDIVARAAGGQNAGHTIIDGTRKFAAHALPSGVLHPNKQLVLGGGMVLNAEKLLAEIHEAERMSPDLIRRLRIAGNAHLALNAHRSADSAREAERGTGKIGTTGSGIGPTYSAKADRSGLRMELLMRNENVIRDSVEGQLVLLQKRFPEMPISIEEEMRAILATREKIRMCIQDRDFSLRLIDEIRGGKNILIEGAQAFGLDIDHGDYPNVTSSATTPAGALQGLGLPTNIPHEIVGVAKAYLTAVGTHDLPTKIEGSLAREIQEKGHEYGATTGRRRDVAWLNLPELHRACRMTGCKILALLKLDVLDGLESIPVATEIMKSGKAKYAIMPGWEKTAGIQNFDDLPSTAKTYVKMVEAQVGCSVGFVGTGRSREELIIRAPR